MADQQHHHHHHHHRKDASSRFKERQLNAIVRRKLIEKWLKIALTVVAALMVLALIASYFIR